jgi:hypothetical protein
VGGVSIKKRALFGEPFATLSLDSETNGRFSPWRSAHWRSYLSSEYRKLNNTGVRQLLDSENLVFGVVPPVKFRCSGSGKRENRESPAPN